MALTGGGRTALVTDAFRLADLQTPGIDTANAITDAFINAFKTVTSLDWRFFGAIVRFGPLPTGPTFDVGRNVGSSGASSSLPPNTSVLFQKRAAVGGRSNRGRFFVPGIAEASVDAGGLITPTLLASYQSAGENYRTSAEAAAGIDNLVILHDEAIVDDPTTVVSLQAQALVATQRRRLR